MTKVVYFPVLILLLSSCIGQHKSDAQKIVVHPESSLHVAIEADTLTIDLRKSTIDWIATEMRQTKRRTGVISFHDGFFLSKNKELVGGKFTVAMNSMDITDVPLHEKIARKNLLDHLKSDDFFNVAAYPLSTLEITSIEKIKQDSLNISANLSIREVTRNIQFYAHYKDRHFTTRFTFNRLDWNIAYEGSWADKTLVDKDVELQVSIVVKDAF
tara:strand:+ start:4314 stop:4955 length:642 start_codon:yes stop_codon:yes gene_type:complete